MIPTYVLDASALLALIRNEPGSGQVLAVLDASVVHPVNLAEGARKMVAKGMPVRDVERFLRDMQLPLIEEFPTKAVYEVARLTAEALRLGLSLGDCVCLATAQSRRLTAVTAERRWSEVRLPVQVLRIR